LRERSHGQQDNRYKNFILALFPPFLSYRRN
jgi:hypothetical protein